MVKPGLEPVKSLPELLICSAYKIFFYLLHTKHTAIKIGNKVKKKLVMKIYKYLKKG